MRVADFHEDDYCQIEILPCANWDHIQAEFVKLIAFSRAHEAPGGFGWSDMYVGNAPPVRLAALQLDVADLSARLQEYLMPFDKVTSGWSSVVEELPNARAWGNDRSFVLFADFTDAGKVRNIWLHAWELTSTEAGSAVRALTQLPRRAELFLADWNRAEAVRLTDTARLQEYLQGRGPGDDR